jgi:hypothetical protein
MGLPPEYRDCSAVLKRRVCFLAKRALAHLPTITAGFIIMKNPIFRNQKGAKSLIFPVFAPWRAPY